jgi:chorismate-pyruvate lyase
VIADRLAARHFTAQAELPEGLATVAIGALEPLLRVLLVTDGTVSRTLEASALRSVGVEPVEESAAETSAAAVRPLRLEPGESCLRRRVVMTIAGPEPSVWAESYVVPGRLPPGFLRALGGNTQGIGGSLEALKLETSRELLWFGLGPAPDWHETATSRTPTLTRAYLVLTGGRPALLICEAFAVAERAGRYVLARADDGDRGRP